MGMTKKTLKSKKAARQAHHKPIKKPTKKTAKKTIKKTAKKVVKKTGKKIVKKTPARKSTSVSRVAVPAKPIGEVTHFYTHIKVGIVKFKQPIKIGTNVRFKGATTDFAQALDSMQYDHKPIKLAPKGKLIGLKVKKRVRQGDMVYMEKK